MSFRGKRSGIIQKFTMDVDPGYYYIEKFRGGVQWYMMESNDIISFFCFKLKKEKNQLVSFNGQKNAFSIINQGNLGDGYINSYEYLYLDRLTHIRVLLLFIP